MRSALSCLQFAPRDNNNGYGEVVSFFPVEQGTVDLLAKACAHAGIKAIGMKTTVITSGIFAIGLLNLKKKHEQMES